MHKQLAITGDSFVCKKTASKTGNCKQNGGKLKSFSHSFSTEFHIKASFTMAEFAKYNFFSAL